MTDSTTLGLSTTALSPGPDSTEPDRGIVLIVDDTPNNLKVLSETLAEANVEIAIATSGEGALAQLQRMPVSLILLDVMMPGIDGFETCQRLKSNPETADIPVIFITALADTVNKVKGFELGAVDYISKPFEAGEVLARVRTHLNLSQLSQTLAAKNSQLKQLTEQLENRVEQRTEALSASTAELKDTQLQVVQNEKMATLGSLVAGVAHEVNNPIGFLHGSIQNAKNYFQDLCEHLKIYHHQSSTQVVQDHAEEIDLDFILEDFPKLLDSMAAATTRIKGISTSLRTFSRADTEHKVSASLTDGLESTLLILKYRLKPNDKRPAIKVTKHYGELPEIECFPGQLNQVFMNILANAVDMFDEVAEQTTFAELANSPQEVTIQTTLLVDKKRVEIRISDNGQGMTEAVKAKLFERSFTTKTVGKGTGLGLAIAQQIVVEAHGGTLEVQSELGQGTEFCIQLPL